MLAVAAYIALCFLGGLSFVLAARSWTGAGIPRPFEGVWGRLGLVALGVALFLLSGPAVVERVDSTTMLSVVAMSLLPALLWGPFLVTLIVDAFRSLLFSPTPGSVEPVRDWSAPEFALARGEPGEAVRLYREALATEPGLAHPYRRIAEIEAKRGNFAEAAASAAEAFAWERANRRRIAEGDERLDLVLLQAENLERSRAYGKALEVLHACTREFPEEAKFFLIDRRIERVEKKRARA